MKFEKPCFYQCPLCRPDGSQMGATIEPKLPEPKLSEPKLPEPQLPEPKLPEPQLPEPKLLEPQLPEPKLPEPTMGSWKYCSECFQKSGNKIRHKCQLKPNIRLPNMAAMISDLCSEVELNCVLSCLLQAKNPTEIRNVTIPIGKEIGQLAPI